MNELLRPLIVVSVLLITVTGGVYPLIVTGAGAVLFHKQIGGSLIDTGGRLVGSELIAQPFTDPRYFWGRLSATAPLPNNGTASGGSNVGPSNPELLTAAKQRIAALQAAEPGRLSPVPVDLVTASGSGLDPHISPAAALYQVNRVAAMRHMDTEQLRKQVLAAVEQPQWGIFGEPRVNVLMLNLALDRAR